MCGLAGWAGEVDLPERALHEMCDKLHHRGPDDEGFLVVPGRAALGVRRLAVIDPLTGNQPLFNEDRSVAVTCNGEIYNFQALRGELERRGHSFRTGSDAEVICHLYEELGPDCLHRLHGMFAIALWDQRAARMMLAIDRMGVKPLYWAPLRRGLVYASEASAVLVSGALRPRPDPEAIMQYLTLQYMPAPLTGLEGLRKLAPGERLLFDGRSAHVEHWWRLPEWRKPAPISGTDALARVDEALRDATRRRLVSDVPVGALLSGGIDSSIVVSYMAEHADQVKTFSIDVPVDGYSEASHAHDVSRTFSTDHHELVVEPHMLPASIETIGAIGEPFADSSAIPTRLVAQLARSHVTVALAGDGGDEAFGGYQRYVDLQRLDRWRPAGRPIAAMIPPPVRRRSLRLNEFSRVMHCSAHDRYAEWMTHFRLHQLEQVCHPEFIRAAGGIRRAWDHVLALPEGEGINRYARADTLTYLPGDLLVKVDRMSMAHSLEVRSPFLDHNVVQLAAALPSRLKLRRGASKWILRKLALARGVPPSAVDRPKMGFAVPVGLWMRHELKEWVEDLVLSPEARGRGYFVESELSRLVTDHLEGRENHEVRLWNLAMLELWHRLWIDRSFGPGDRGPARGETASRRG